MRQFYLGQVRQSRAGTLGETKSWGDGAGVTWWRQR